MYIPRFEQTEDLSPSTIRFPGVDERSPADNLPDLSQKITLPGFYESHVLPELGNRRANTLKEQRIALTHWRSYVGDIDIRDVDRPTLQAFRDGLLIGRRPATVNKCWRQLGVIFSHATYLGIIPRVPQIGIGMRTRLVDEPPKVPRAPITTDELTRLWQACSHATYPETVLPAPVIWRVALLLLWLYAQRTRDVFSLKWDENVCFDRMLLSFEAMKTRKIQTLPLHTQAARHLKAIRRNTTHILPGMLTKGFQRRKGKKINTWKRGYSTTWRNEILSHAGLSVPIQLKHFRETAITRYNRNGELGGWIAGHAQRGVTKKFYDNPSPEVYDAIEQQPIPECFTWDVI